MTAKRSGGALEGRTILLLTRYGHAGPSSRMRFYQYADALREAGATLIFSPLFDDAYVETLFRTGANDLRATVRGYVRRIAALAFGRADLVWVEKELLPFLPGMFERLLTLRGRPYAVDYDDAIFHNYDLSGRRLVRVLLGRKLDPLLRGAALVTAGNAYLADYARAHGARTVEIVPTVVDLHRYPRLPPRSGERIRIGWIGTPANARYLQPIVAALNRLRSRFPLTLVTIGAGDIPGLEIPHEKLTWSQEREAELIASFDVGVMPLPDSPWERGKCGYKLIQYMAAARPVVASPVGVNQTIVTSDVGFLADSEDAWMEAIAALAADPVLRARMGQCGRESVARHYALAVTAPALIEAFARLLEQASGTGSDLDRHPPGIIDPRQ